MLRTINLDENLVDGVWKGLIPPDFAQSTTRARLLAIDRLLLGKQLCGYCWLWV